MRERRCNHCGVSFS
ncbi:hypothetical protein E2C01_080010 [Portunus trituberculatus]|uniref:Uncharacterized protein n=2 Tax=Portunus trituberculatus TaxID=210409 RepID=A0A5B7IS09_PORTR|nr:hypothetical protein [Portunus trituberculatus]